MMVSVALFAIVMLIAGATLLSLVYANRKAQALQSVVNNLNVSLDAMVRNIREGSNYRCGVDEEPLTGNCDGNDTPLGGTILYFTPFGKTADDNAQDDIAYALCTGVDNAWAPVTGQPQAGTDYALCENEYGAGWVPITSPQVQIQSMTFYVTGTTPASKGGTQQPKVIFVIKGQAGTQANTVSTFDIQATAVQRELNL